MVASHHLHLVCLYGSSLPSCFISDLKTSCYCQCSFDHQCHNLNCDKLCFKTSFFQGTCKNSETQTICCSTHISPSVKQFRAFRLGPAHHVLTLKFRQFSNNFKTKNNWREISYSKFRVTDSSSVNYRSEQFDLFLRALNFPSSNFVHEPKIKDWVLTSSTDIDEKVYRVDKKYVNDVLERDPTKLGWFRPANSGFLFTNKLKLN